MSREELSSRNVALLSFIAGAAVGALVVALTTPKTGSEVRGGLKALGRRAKYKLGEMGEQAGDAWADSKDQASATMADLQRGIKEVAHDLQS